MERGFQKKVVVTVSNKVDGLRELSTGKGHWHQVWVVGAEVSLEKQKNGGDRCRRWAVGPALSLQIIMGALCSVHCGSFSSALNL